ncbi:riboflavin synthase, partial [candidate division WOR-3 bacterium]|nr:riboflavin synthase [candidate division WOR-3 bacterium]
MFTGIIENLGTVKDIRRKLNGMSLSVEAKQMSNTFKVGGSVAVNGTCLTIINFLNDTFTVDVVTDTLNRTNLSLLRKNDSVNIE